MVVSKNEFNFFHADDEIDLREVASAFRRRWIWIASGGFLGVATAGMFTLKEPVEMPFKTIAKHSKRSFESVIQKHKSAQAFKATSKNLTHIEK